VVNVKVSEASELFHQFLTVRDLAKKLVRQSCVEWSLARWIHQPPEAECHIEWLLTQISQDYSGALHAAGDCCRQIVCEELSEAACMLDQTRVRDLLIEKSLEALAFHDLL
jgi:hypothetical protein